MAADYSRIHRLLKILLLIQGQKGWTAQSLAEDCGVTPRTIFRDMEMLEGAGVPYFFDPETKGYQLRGDFFMRPLELTLDESLALIVLSEHIGGDEQVPFTRAASTAVAKIRGQLPDRLQQELGEFQGRLKVRLAAAGASEGLSDVYEKVRYAIAKGCVLRCRYERAALDGSPPDDKPFGFRPYTLFFCQRAWYAIGQHDGRDAVRTLKLSRFSMIELTKERYAVPQSYSPDRYLGNAWRMIRGSKSYQVELHFDPQFAETIADTYWHETQEIHWQDDGSIVFQCTVDGLSEIVWWVLSMGSHCVVKKPIELQQLVKRHAQQIVDAYTPQELPPSTPVASGRTVYNVEGLDDFP